MFIKYATKIAQWLLQSSGARVGADTKLAFLVFQAKREPKFQGCVVCLNLIFLIIKTMSYSCCFFGRQKNLCISCVFFLWRHKNIIFCAWLYGAGVIFCPEVVHECAALFSVLGEGRRLVVM